MFRTYYDASIACLLVATIAAGVAACDDDSSETTRNDVADSVDVSVDDGSGDLAPDGEVLDDVGLMCEPPRMYTGTPRPWSARCSGDDACERLTTCSAGECRTIVGCAGRQDSRDEGCFYGLNHGAVYTQQECTCDAQCADSPHGDWCIDFACQVGPPCADGCPPGTECFEDTVCLTPDQTP